MRLRGLKACRGRGMRPRQPTAALICMPQRGDFGQVAQRWAPQKQLKAEADTMSPGKDPDDRHSITYHKCPLSRLAQPLRGPK